MSDLGVLGDVGVLLEPVVDEALRWESFPAPPPPPPLDGPLADPEVDTEGMFPDAAFPLA